MCIRDRYRAVTLAWLNSGLELNEENICKMLSSIDIKIITGENGQRTLLNGKDVSEDIRLPQVTNFVSPVSAISCVREKLVSIQRELAKNGAVVLEGRDIGTVVFPDAELKIYLVASVDARAKRRTKELLEKGLPVNEQEIKQQIIERDKYDSNRDISPLRKANDAIEIDTSNLTIEEQCNKIIELVENL